MRNYNPNICIQFILPAPSPSRCPCVHHVVSVQTFEASTPSRSEGCGRQRQVHRFDLGKNQQNLLAFELSAFLVMADKLSWSSEPPSRNASTTVRASPLSLIGKGAFTGELFEFLVQLEAVIAGNRDRIRGRRPGTAETECCRRVRRRYLSVSSACGSSRPLRYAASTCACPDAGWPDTASHRGRSRGC